MSTAVNPRRGFAQVYAFEERPLQVYERTGDVSRFNSVLSEYLSLIESETGFVGSEVAVYLNNRSGDSWGTGCFSCAKGRGPAPNVIGEMMQTIHLMDRANLERSLLLFGILCGSTWSLIYQPNALITEQRAACNILALFQELRVALSH